MIMTTITGNSQLLNIPSNTLSYSKINRYFVSELAAVEEVKDLHHHKHVKDEGVVTRGCMVHFVNWFVVTIPIWKYASATAHSTSLDYPVVVFGR